MQAVAGFINRYRYVLAVVGIVLLGGFMRYYRLGDLPPGLHPDEAANGLDVFRILEHHDFRPFYSANGGREALFFYLQAIGVAIMGNTTLALRVAPAAIGTLSCLAVYLWASSWFGRKAGLIASFLMAVTPWAVTISRDGFRAGMVALMIPLILWLFGRAAKTGLTRWYVLSGIAVGLGFYTYLAFRLFPLAIAAVLAFMFIWRRAQIKAYLPGLVISFVTMAIVLIPMAWYGVHHPGDIVGRPSGVSFTNPSLNHGHPLQTLGSTMVKTALMFNFQGDDNYRHNLGGQPEFNIFVGVMFVLGIFVALIRIRQLRYFALLMVFGAMLAPEVLTAEGIPHSLRAIGALPAALVLAAVGITYMLDSWNGVFPLNTVARASGTVAVVVLLGLTAYQGYVQYFVAWANAPETYEAYSEDTTALANYFNHQPFTGQRYAVGGGYGYMPLQYLAHNHSTYTRVDTKELDALPLQPGTAKEFAVEEGDKQTALQHLKVKFPKGRISPHYSAFSGEELFVIYTVPAS